MLLYFKLKKQQQQKKPNKNQTQTPTKQKEPKQTHNTKPRTKNLYQTIYKTYKHFELSKYTAIQLKYQETGYTDCYTSEILFAILLTI